MSASRRSSLLLLPVLLCALLLGAAPAASAQCFGPDGLDIGPCCAPALPNLPLFPAASLPGLGICWQQCTPNQLRTLKVAWTPPASPNCGEYTTLLTVNDGISGLPMLAGVLTLDYTRTWTEVDPSGVSTQVWRFAAKADLSSVATGAPPCPVPNCIAPAGPHPTAFYYGYVDYASCAAAGPWENVLVLFHNCDRFIHQPGFSDRPGVFHPGASFAIVAPHSTLQPFLPMNSVAGGGPLVGEAARDHNVPGTPPPLCIVEDRVLQGSMQPLGAGCVCTLATNPKQQTLRQFTGSTSCAAITGIPGGWTSLNLNFPVLPWFHMVTTSIGTWGNPNVYPGNEFAWVDEGLFIHQDSCVGDFIELKYGGSTAKGWTAMLMTGVVAGQFTDIADNYTAPLLGPYPFPILGSVRPTDHLIYVNEP